MPFQISLHSNVKQRGIINSFNAGIDQFATCASQITLTAVVDGNLGGHIILWEQISGDTQIVWLTPVNQLEVTFAIVGGGSSDRTFRFYIDKGTPLEQFDEVVTWGTPTSQETRGYSVIAPPTVTDIACRNIPCSSITIKYPVDAPTPMGTYVTNPTSGYLLTWSNPTCDISWFVSTTVIRNQVGNMVSLGDIPAGINTVSLPSLSDVYYLYANYKQDQTVYSQYSCRFENTLQTDEVIFTTDTLSSSASSNNVTSAVYYSLVPLLPQPVETLDTSASSTNVVTTVYYTLNMAPLSTSTLQGVASSINTTTVTYYSNNGIGG